MENGLHIPQFSEEAWIHHSLYVKYQRPLVPILIHKQPLRDVKSGVWWAISATRIITPIFFSKVIDSYEYVTHISTKIPEDLFDYESTYAIYQQYIAAKHGVFQWKYFSPRANIQFNLRLYTIAAHRIILNAWLQIVFSVRIINLPAPQTTISLGLCEPFLILPWSHTVC